MRLIVLLFLSFSAIQLHSQEAEIEKEKLDFVFSPGIILQHQFFNELNLTIGRVTVEKYKIPVVGLTGFRFGVEHNFKSGNQFIIAPKVGYEISVTAFSIRLSAANYFQNNSSEFRIIPEIGISSYGFFNLTYGYGITINKSDISKLGNHRVSLSFNLDKRLTKAVFTNNYKKSSDQ